MTRNWEEYHFLSHQQHHVSVNLDSLIVLGYDFLWPLLGPIFELASTKVSKQFSALESTHLVS